MKVTSFLTKKPLNNQVQNDNNQVQNDQLVDAREAVSGEARSHSHHHCEPLSLHSSSQQQITDTDMAILPDDSPSSSQMFQLR